MSTKDTHSKLWHFFFADGFRISLNVFNIIGIIFFIFVIYKTYTKRKNSKYNILFLMMISVMISGLILNFGFLLNWKIKKDDNTNERELLFGNTEGFICQAQSFIIASSQSSRETFTTLLIFLVFLDYFSENLKTEQLYLKILVEILGFGLPFIAALIYSLLGAFGESHLFCFTKKKVDTVTSTCGTIHFFYIFILLILSVVFTLFIIFKDCCKKYDAWADDKDVNEVNLEVEKKKKRLDPKLKKIIFYPIAQICSMFFVFYYRFRDYFFHNINDNNGFIIAGWVAIANIISSLVYTLIFSISNSIFTSPNEINIEKDKTSDSKEYNLYDVEEK